MRFVPRLEALFALFIDKELVVSERFHGVICALHAGKRTFTLTRGDHNEAKIQELFRSFGVDDFCWDTFAVLEGAFPHEAAGDAMPAARMSYHAATDVILGELFQERIKQRRRRFGSLLKRRLICRRSDRRSPV